MYEAVSAYRFMFAGSAFVGSLLGTTPQRIAAEVLIRQDFSGVTAGSLLGPAVVPSAERWVNASGHEAGVGPAFARARGLAEAYDHDNDPATPDVAIPGGYELNGYADNSPGHTLTITVTMPALLDDAGVASLTFWAASRPGSGSDGTLGSSVHIRNTTDSVDVVPPAVPRFDLNASRWRFNRFTFPQLASYAGDTFEVTFTAGGADGGSGLELANLTFETDAHVESRATAPQEKDRDRHDGFMAYKQELLKSGPIQLVFLGDSITDHWRGAPQHQTYYGRWGRYNPFNLGVSADETQHVLWRIQHGELDGLSPKAIVLLIGTNNIGNANRMSVGETVLGIRAVVDAIKAKLPATKILLLGVFPRGASASDPFRPMIADINRAIAKLDDGGNTVTFLDLGHLFLDADGNIPADLMPDALHPSARGYELWADAIDPMLHDMLK